LVHLLLKELYRSWVCSEMLSSFCTVYFKVEMPHNREDSLCCGGGGGRMWQDLQGDVKMSEVRIREAEATGVEVVITACPCVSSCWRMPERPQGSRSRSG
jgi:hypothetical protein